MAVKRTTSVAKEVEMHENANSLLAVPKLAGKMTADELEYFYSYADAKAMDDWFPHEPLLLVQLAKLSVRLRDLTKDLEREGAVSVNPTTGKEMRSALAQESEALQRQQLAMMRTLNLSSSARQDKANTTKRAVKEKGVRNKTKAAPTSLLAVAR